MATVSLYILMSCLSVGLVHGSNCNAIIKGDPLTVEQSTGKWSLIAVAHEKNETIYADVGNDQSLVEVHVEDGVPHISYMTITAGKPRRSETRDITVKDGYLTYSDTYFGGKPIFQYVTDDCALFSFNSPTDTHFLYCRSKVPSTHDFRKFIDYAICCNYQHIVVRRDSEPSCLDIPRELKELDLEKLNGMWKTVAVSALHDCEVLREIQLTMDGNMVNVSLGDGSYMMTLQKSPDRLHFKQDFREGSGIDLYESPEDSLLVWMGTSWDHVESLILFSRTGHVDDKEIVKFRHFASCLSTKVVFVNE